MLWSNFEEKNKMIDGVFRSEIRDFIKNNFFGSFLFDEPLKNHTSIGIGGLAEVIYTPKDDINLAKLLEFADIFDIPITIIGNGTNIICCDEGIRGIVIKVAGTLDHIDFQGTICNVGAGCSISNAARLSEKHGLSGLEFGVGIPGNIGGALVTNAGTQKSSIGDRFLTAKVMDLKGRIFELNKESLIFRYRYTSLKNMQIIILSASFQLESIDRNFIRERMNNLMRQRSKKLPLREKSAGSVFKNPKDNFAARLIEESNCKGLKIGEAEISEKHANFIINRGNATAKDFLTLMKIVQKIVNKKFGINLEPEVEFLGFGEQ